MDILLTNRPNADFESTYFHRLLPAPLPEITQQTAAILDAGPREDEHFYEIDRLCPVVEQFFEWCS